MTWIRLVCMSAILLVVTLASACTIPDRCSIAR